MYVKIVKLLLCTKCDKYNFQTFYSCKLLQKLFLSETIRKHIFGILSGKETKVLNLSFYH